MQKNSILIATLLLFLSGCVSVLSQMSDEEAWNDYLKELKIHQQHEDRTLASAEIAAVTPSKVSITVTEARPGIKILRQILETMPFRNYLMSCDHRECYQSQLVLAFDQAFRRVKEQGITLSAEEYTAEQKAFLDAYSYEKVLSWVETFHQMLLSGVELRSAQRAVELARTCEGTFQSETEIQLTNFSPYLGGLSYLPKAYYSCLNEHWQSELDQLLKETTDRLGIMIKTAEAKRWIIQKQISPIYRKTLNDIFMKRKQEEEARWNQEWSEIEKKIDWKRPMDDLIRDEVPSLRKTHHFLNLEALLTERRLSKK